MIARRSYRNKAPEGVHPKQCRFGSEPLTARCMADLTHHVISSFVCCPTAFRAVALRQEASKLQVVVGSRQQTKCFSDEPTLPQEPAGLVMLIALKGAAIKTLEWHNGNEWWSSGVVTAHHPLGHWVLQAHGDHVGVVLQLTPTYVAADFVKPVTLEKCVDVACEAVVTSLLI